MAQTKEQLLQYFAGLDLSLLQKLEKYSKLLIIPDEDLLTYATMVQMVEKAHSVADSLFPEWTDRSKSDFGEFLVELIALFSEKDFWYLNAFANEGILRKMRSYSNAFSKASSLGYFPTVCASAKATFNITFSAGEASTYKQGDLVIDVDGKKFTNVEDISLETSSAEVTLPIELHEGNYFAEDITYNGYSVIIRKENIDIDSIRLIIDNIIYTRVRTFGESDAGSTHYMVLPDEDGSVNIFFGSEGYGISPSIGKGIRVEYLKCNGSDGNITSREATVTDSLASREATAVTMLTDATGGTYAETLTSIKNRTSLIFATKNAAINEQVSTDILNSFNFVYQSRVEVVGRNVNYSVIVNTGTPEPTEEQKQYLVDNFTPYLLVGYVGVYTPNNYVDALEYLGADSMVVKVIILSGYNAESIKASVVSLVQDYTNPLVKATYGGSLLKTELDVLIRSSVQGVQNCTFFVKKGESEELMSDITLSAGDIFSTLSADKITVTTNVL